MHIAIVEDNEKERHELLQMLHAYFLKMNTLYTYDTYAAGEEFLKAFHPGSYDLVFLDIYMDGISGMDTARAVRRTDSSCPLFFISASRMHAVESYEVQAVYYLTKPLEETAFLQAMDRVCSRLTKANRYLTVSVKGHLHMKLLLKDILFVDCLARKTHIHLENTQLVIDNSIASVLEILSEDERFLSCNRNVLVNMDWVECIPQEEFIMKNQEHVPIRQRGRGAVKKAFLEYTLKELRKGEFS